MRSTVWADVFLSWSRRLQVAFDCLADGKASGICGVPEDCFQVWKDFRRDATTRMKRNTRLNELTGSPLRMLASLVIEYRPLMLELYMASFHVAALILGHFETLCWTQPTSHAVVPLLLRLTGLKITSSNSSLELLRRCQLASKRSQLVHGWRPPSSHMLQSTRMRRLQPVKHGHPESTTRARYVSDEMKRMLNMGHSCLTAPCAFFSKCARNISDCIAFEEDDACSMLCVVHVSSCVNSGGEF